MGPAARNGGAVPTRKPGCKLGRLIGLEVNNDESTLQSEPLPGRCVLGLQSIKTLAEGGPLSAVILTTEARTRSLDALNRALLCARVADENKARDVLVLDMRGITPIYDFLVLATGNSRRQIHTLAEEIDEALHRVGDKRRSIAGYDASRWVVQDYGDVVVHIFDAETRAYYALEDLWADAKRVDWERE